MAKRRMVQDSPTGAIGMNGHRIEPASPARTDSTPSLLVHSARQVLQFDPERNEKKKAKRCGSRFCLHRRSCRSNARRGFMKGFWVGSLARGGVVTLTGLLFRGMYRRPVKLLTQVFGADTLRFGLFFGFFTGGFKGVQCFLRRLRQKEDRWNAFLAGVAASSAMLVEASGRQTTWALWMMARALDLLWRSGVSHRHLPDLSNGPLIVFVLATFQVMWCWHLEPEALPKGYRTWISARGGLDDRVVTGVREIINGRTPKMVPWCQERKIPLWTPVQPQLMPCTVLHPHVAYSCVMHAAWRWVEGFKSGLPVYSTVHLLPLFIFHLKRLRTNPVGALAHTLKAIFFSTTFITSLQTIFWLTFCTVRKVLQRDSRWATGLASFLCGFSVLFEKQSRRAELALFTLPRALDSLWRVLLKQGFVRHVEHSQYVLFGLSMGFIMMFYQHEPKVIKATYYNLMKRYFGQN